MKLVMSQNLFLASLPRPLQEAFDLHAEIFEVQKGPIKNCDEGSSEDVYFPLNCLYSVDIRMTDGFQAHLAMLGYRHILAKRYFSEPAIPGAARVIVSGYALRLPVEVFIAEWQRSPELQRAVQDQLFQFTRTLGVATACNMHHPLQRRLARWLVSAAEASCSTHFELTHEEMASLLGVRREAVTESLSRLSLLGAIETTRGRVSIQNPQRLREAACECCEINIQGLPQTKQPRERQRLVALA